MVKGIGHAAFNVKDMDKNIKTITVAGYYNSVFHKVCIGGIAKTV